MPNIVPLRYALADYPEDDKNDFMIFLASQLNYANKNLEHNQIPHGVEGCLEFIESHIDNVDLILFPESETIQLQLKINL